MKRNFLTTCMLIVIGCSKNQEGQSHFHKLNTVFDPIDRGSDECFALQQPSSYVGRFELYPWEVDRPFKEMDQNSIPISMFQCLGHPNNPCHKQLYDCHQHVEEEIRIDPKIFSAFVQWKEVTHHPLQVIKGWRCKVHEQYVQGEDAGYFQGKRVDFLIPGLSLEEGLKAFKKAVSLKGLLLSIEMLSLADLDNRGHAYALTIRSLNDSI